MQFSILCQSLLAYTSARVFGANEFVAMALGGTMCYPSILSLMAGGGTYPYAGSGIDQGQLHIISHSYYNRCVYPGLCTAVSGAGDTGGPENYSGTGDLPAGNGACGILWCLGR